MAEISHCDADDIYKRNISQDFFYQCVYQRFQTFFIFFLEQKYLVPNGVKYQP